jgi:alpha-1,2-mannosyltransferase
MRFEELKQKQLNIFLIIISLFIVFQYSYSIGILCIKGEFGDFKSYYIQSKLIEGVRYSRSAEEISNVLISERGIYYPPIFYLIFSRITNLTSFLSLQFQSCLWLLLNQFLLFCAVLFILKVVMPDKKLSFFKTTMIIFLTLNYLPTHFNNEGGQFNIFILFLISGALLSSIKKKDFLAGFLIAIATCLKWFPGVLFLLFFIKKRYRVVASGTLTLIFAFLSSIIFYGWFLHLILLKTLLKVSSDCSTSLINHSLAAFWGRLFIKGTQTYGILNFPALSSFLTIISVLVLIILSSKIVYENKKNSEFNFLMEYNLFVVLTILVSSYIHIHHLVLLLLPFLSIFLISSAGQKTEKYFPLFISAYLLTGLTYWPDGLSFLRKGFWVIFLSGRFYGTLLLWIGIYLSLKIDESRT